MESWVSAWRQVVFLPLRETSEALLSWALILAAFQVRPTSGHCSPCSRALTHLG